MVCPDFLSSSDVEGGEGIIAENLIISMEALTSDKGISLEVARESLMTISQSVPEKSIPEAGLQSFLAISQSIPDMVPVPRVLPEISTGTNVAELDGRSVEEECRSKLISISSMQSPDMESLLSLPGSLTA